MSLTDDLIVSRSVTARLENELARLTEAERVLTMERDDWKVRATNAAKALDEIKNSRNLDHKVTSRLDKKHEDDQQKWVAEHGRLQRELNAAKASERNATQALKTAAVERQVAAQKVIDIKAEVTAAQAALTQEVARAAAQHSGDQDKINAATRHAAAVEAQLTTERTQHARTNSVNDSLAAAVALKNGELLAEKAAHQATKRSMAEREASLNEAIERYKAQFLEEQRIRVAISNTRS